MGHSGEIAVTVRFITGAAGVSPPEDIVRLVAVDLTKRLRRLQTEGEQPPLGAYMIQVAEASYESHREGGPRVAVAFDDPPAVP